MLAMREVREVYHRGVWAVAVAFRQLYELIDADEERVQKLVAAASVAHLLKIKQLRGRITNLEEEVANRARQVRRLELEVRGFKRELKEARKQARLLLEPRSAYLLSGPARDEWEHSITRTDALRYSITFRSLRGE